MEIQPSGLQHVNQAVLLFLLKEDVTPSHHAGCDFLGGCGVARNFECLSSFFGFFRVLGYFGLERGLIWTCKKLATENLGLAERYSFFVENHPKAVRVA